MSRDRETEMSARFAKDITDHTMTIAHDDGLYRHVQFRNREHGWNLWFDLITVPGALVFQGDGESFVFRRVEDMFEFFRGSQWQTAPNYGYWAEKLTSGRGSVRRYDQELLEERVRERVAEAVEENPGKFPGLIDAVETDLLAHLAGNHALDLDRVLSYTYYANPDHEWRSDKWPDFSLESAWEWTVEAYDWWYLWACNAILWGIGQYDAHKAAAVAS